MPAYTTTVTHATGDVFPATDWNTYIRDNLAFLHDQGADLPSGATITPTNQFHRVTGTTTITTIAAPSGTGQGGNRILLKFQSAGCTITAGAAIVLTNGAFTSLANGTIELVWDSTLAGWVEIGRVNFDHPGKEWDYQPITANVSISATTEGTANAVVTGNSVTYDGAKVKVEFYTPAIVTATSLMDLRFVVLRDSTVLGQAEANPTASGDTFQGPAKVEVFDTPSAAAHIYKIAAFCTGTTPVIGAGLGGSGNRLAAYLRTTKA